MSDVTSVGNNTSSLDVSPQFSPYSKVIINVSDGVAFIAGDDTGRTLEVDNPFGTQAMANNMLAQLRNYQYQPYEASGALLNPAAEIGDAVTVSDAYGGLYRRNTKFGRLMKSDIAAPQDEEVNHEYAYESPQDRKLERKFGEVSASIAITNDAITSEVTNRQNADTALQNNLQNQISTSAATVTSNLQSQISQTASSIQSTVASATSKYDTTGLTISYYGFGTPTAIGLSPSGKNNQLYLDQSTGFYYKSNGSTWTKQNSTALKLITTNLSTKLTQTADGLTSEVSRAKAAEGTLSSSITQQATQIAAKVSSSGGSSSSFGLSLTASGFKLYSGSKTVLNCTSSGMEVSGKITATSGKIGGFDIQSDYLSYNSLKWGDTNKATGAYIGQKGIQLGKNFKVDNSGNVTATNITLSGTLRIGDATIDANTLRQGAAQAYAGYSGWNSTTNTVNTNGGYWSGGAAGGFEYKSYFHWSENLGALEYYGGQTLYAPYFASNGGYRGDFYITDANGGNGHYSTLYYKTMAVMTGGSLYREINWSTGDYEYRFSPQFSTILYVTAR